MDQIPACEACRPDAPKVTDEEITKYIKQLPEWNVIEVDGIKQLERKFKFKNFRKALAFTNAIGEIAEGENHHPGLLTEWGSVTVTWWTHKIEGLHELDFAMAKRCDGIFTG